MEMLIKMLMVALVEGIKIAKDSGHPVDLPQLKLDALAYIQENCKDLKDLGDDIQDMLDAAAAAATVKAEAEAAAKAKADAT